MLSAGGLTVIIRSVCQENIGKTVRLTMFIEKDERFIHKNKWRIASHDTWMVETLDGSNSLLVPPHGGGEAEWVDRGTCRPGWLMPLHGDPDAVVVDKKELALS